MTIVHALSQAASGGTVGAVHGSLPRRISMKTKSIGYWSTTALVALAFAAGGAADLARAPNVVAGMNHLGYPAYFAAILGTWKLLGAVAVLAPRWPRLKEWAYAGMLFDLTGAALSHGASGDPAGKVITP